MKSKSCRVAVAALTMALAIPLGALAQTTPPSGTVNGTPQVEQPPSGGVNWKGAGVGAATLLANVGYIPAKTVYAILGGIAGGAGYALTGGNQQTADSIWRSSLGGDYVLTPEMIKGEAPIHFSGPSNPTAPASAASQPISSNPPPPSSMTASSAPVYPNTTTYSPPPSTSSTSGVGAPPLSAAGGHSGYGSSGGSAHFTTSITGPGDSGTGPVREHDIE
jgi:hypothetical protein